MRPISTNASEATVQRPGGAYHRRRILGGDRGPDAVVAVVEHDVGLAAKAVDLRREQTCRWARARVTVGRNFVG